MRITLDGSSNQNLKNLKRFKIFFYKIAIKYWSYRVTHKV